MYLWAERWVIAKMQRRRKLVATEILTTEATYVSGLRDLIQLYMKPIEESSLLSSEDIKHIFGGIHVMAVSQSTTHKTHKISLFSRGLFRYVFVSLSAFEVFTHTHTHTHLRDFMNSCLPS